MQEISAWFLVISVMILFFAIVLNMYKDLFVNIVPVSDEEIHTSNHTIRKEVSRDTKKAKSTKKMKKSDFVLNIEKPKAQSKNKVKSNISNKLNNQKTSRAYQSKYTSYREYKKYNNVSR